MLLDTGYELNPNPGKPVGMGLMEVTYGLVNSVSFSSVSQRLSGSLAPPRDYFHRSKTYNWNRHTRQLAELLHPPPRLTNLKMWVNTMRKIKRKPQELPLPWKVNQKQDHICVGVPGISANIWNFANDRVMISTRFPLTLPADATQKAAGSRRTTLDYQKNNHVVTAIAAAVHLMWLPCLDKWARLVSKMQPSVWPIRFSSCLSLRTTRSSWQCTFAVLPRRRAARQHYFISCFMEISMVCFLPRISHYSMALVIMFWLEPANQKTTTKPPANPAPLGSFLRFCR